MKALWIALGIVGTIPLLAAAPAYAQQGYSQQRAAFSPPEITRSVIKPVGFFNQGGCGCQQPAPTCAAPTCCTPVPGPSIGNCCPKPCLLERLHRGLRSLDCLLPCSLGCNSINCHSSCGCSAGCETRSSCGSCCTKSRAHFFAFCKPKCGFGCGSSCASCVGPVGCCAPTCSTPCQLGCCDGVPSMHPPVPMSDENPFKDDIRPMDPNTPAPGQSTYKQYYKKNNNTATARNTTPMPTPAKLDPYAAAPVRIKAVPAATPVKIASREHAKVKVAIAQEIETVSLSIADDTPPAPPATVSTFATAAPVSTANPIRLQRYDASIPSNPLR